MTSSCKAACFCVASSAAFLAASCSRSFLIRASSANSSASSSCTRIQSIELHRVGICVIIQPAMCLADHELKALRVTLLLQSSKTCEQQLECSLLSGQQVDVYNLHFIVYILLHTSSSLSSDSDSSSSSPSSSASTAFGTKTLGFPPTPVPMSGASRSFRSAFRCSVATTS